MDKSIQGKSDFDCFTLFSNSPKNVSIEVMKGAHKFVAKSIKNGDSGPTCSTLIKIFTAFSQQKIKDYVFTRMKKPILLELDSALHHPRDCAQRRWPRKNASIGGRQVQIGRKDG